MLAIQHLVPPEIIRIRQLICRVGDDGLIFRRIISIKQVRSKRCNHLIFYLMCQNYYLLNGIYATIMALLSTKQATQSLADQIILGLLEHLQQIAQKETPILGQKILKFLIECWFTQYKGGAENENSPFYLQILLTTLPHAMIKAMEKNQIEVKNIIQNVEVLMSKRKTEDRLYHLWQSIRNFLNNQEKDAHTQIFLQFLKSSYRRPYLLFNEEMTQVRQLRIGFKIPIVKRYKIWKPQQILVVNDKQEQNFKTIIQYSQFKIIQQFVNYFKLMYLKLLNNLLINYL
ncbi:unnamed protein product [Paramecium primaurelia]|uniref:Uncharacterized protein n=1 Tax=Paramecium primaurelia TaxID=5886 RepID=A0A8S1KQ50_PARPR|nr:unnamed protein product [Paramecium primaurelia]